MVGSVPCSCPSWTCVADETHINLIGEPSPRVCKNHKIGCFSENVPRCQAHSADGLSLIMWRDTGLRWFFCCGFDEGLAQSGRKFGARLKTHVNSPEKRTYLLRPGMSRWLLSWGLPMIGTESRNRNVAQRSHGSLKDTLYSFREKMICSCEATGLLANCIVQLTYHSFPETV